MRRAFYSAALDEFVDTTPQQVCAVLAHASAASGFPPPLPQPDAWQTEVALLQPVLRGRAGSIYLEYSIPRMGRRADAVLLIGEAIFVVELKVGERAFARSALDQVWDYAIDL